jgi:hypothetical protein
MAVRVNRSSDRQDRKFEGHPDPLASEPIKPVSSVDPGVGKTASWRGLPLRSPPGTFPKSSGQARDPFNVANLGSGTSTRASLRSASQAREGTPGSQGCDPSSTSTHPRRSGRTEGAVMRRTSSNRVLPREFRYRRHDAQRISKTHREGCCPERRSIVLVDEPGLEDAIASQGTPGSLQALMGEDHR